MAASVYETLVLHAFDLLASDLKIRDCAIGRMCLGVQTDNDTGLAYVSDETWAKASSQNISEVEAELRGRRLSEILPWYLEEDSLKITIALAAINSLLIHKGEPDPGTWFRELTGKKRLGMVGYFCPIMDRIALTGVTPVIFELKPMPGTHPPEKAPELLPACDTVLITGATFANKSVHHYLPHISPDADTFIFGHTTPLADFLVKTASLGSTAVLDAPGAFADIRQGMGITQLRQYTRKVVRRKNI